MTKHDIAHPAFADFLIALPILLSDDKDYDTEQAWRSFLAGWEAASAKGKEGPLEFTEKDADQDEGEKYAPKMKIREEPTTAGVLPFTCSRCPDPKNPDPRFHPGGGLAHITLKQRVKEGLPPDHKVVTDTRTPEQVLEQRKNAIGGGCCERFGDQMGCDCLRSAERRHGRERCPKCLGSGDDGGDVNDRGMVGVCQMCDGKGFLKCKKS